MKVKYPLVCLSLLCSVASCLAAAPSGLLAHYDFSEGKGQVLHDRSGGNHHGRIEGAKWTRAGKRPALRFDGKGDYVDMGGDPPLKLTGDMTLSVWLRLSASPFPDPNTNYTLVDCESFPNAGFILRVDGGAGRVTFRTSGPKGYRYGECGARMENESDYHVAVTKQGDAVKIFLNGVAGGSFSVGPVGTSAAPFRISHAVQSFSGLLRDVKVFNRALTRSEIGTLFGAEASAYGIAISSWYLPPVAAQLQAWNADSLKGNDMQLATRSAGAWTVTSSVGDMASLYSDNLIDGDPVTSWRSYQPTLEEWAEVAWDFPVLVDRVRVLPHQGSRFATVALFAWQRDAWRPLGLAKLNGKSAAEPIVFTFERIESKRLRLVMTNAKPAHSGLREVEVQGPAQPVFALDNTDHRWRVISAPAWRASAKKDGAGQGDLVATVESAEFTPPAARPGQTVRLRLRLRPHDAMPEACALVATLGEREMNFHRSDYTATRVALRPRVPMNQWKPGETQSVEADIYLPAHSPHGAVDLMLHGVAASGAVVRLVDAAGKDLPDGRAGRLMVQRFPKDPTPDRETHTAKVDTASGTAISIDGRKVAPILFALQTPSLDRYHAYTGQAGVKLYHVQIYPYRISVGDYQRHNYEFVAGHVRNMLRIDPNAYAIIQMDLRTDEAWRNENPGGVLISPDGSRGHESFCSREYREEVVSYLTNLVKFVESQPWGPRVIGYLCELGEPEGVLSGTGVGDYNPQATEAFRDFLRKRYDDSVDRLRQAYGDPALTFDAVNPVPEKVTPRGFDGGCFLDPKTQRLAIDYHEFLASIIPTFLADVCGGTVKRLTGGRALVGSYWGYLTNDLMINHQKNHNEMARLLASPNIDFLASPFWYSSLARSAGSYYRPFQTYDSIRLNGKIHIPECDHRMFRAGTLLRQRNHSREESLAIIRRDMGTALMHGMGAWFSDWTNNDSPDRRQSEPYFLDDQLLAEINALRAKHQETIDLPRDKTGGEIAVFLSGTSYHYHDGNAGSLYGELIGRTVYQEINRIGAPYDELLFEDILKPEVQEGYKLYVFINAFYMTEPQRQAVERLKRNGNTLLWVYAPGYVSDDGVSAENIRRTTGFGVTVDTSGARVAYRLNGASHPILKGLKTGDMSAAVRIAPRFVIQPEPGVAVLGVYGDGKPAFAVRRFKTHKSVYVAAPALSAPVIRNIARYAGCHLYVDEPIYMDATRDFLMFTNTFEKPRRLAVRLPRACDVETLLAGDPVARNATEFTADLAPGVTLLYRLR